MRCQITAKSHFPFLSVSRAMVIIKQFNNERTRFYWTLWVSVHYCKNLLTIHLAFLLTIHRFMCSVLVRLTSVLRPHRPVVGTVSSLTEVDVGADAALVERLRWPHVVTHTQEDLRRLVLTEKSKRLHLMTVRRWSVKCYPSCYNVRIYVQMYYLTSICEMYIGLFIKIQVAVSRHGGIVMDPSYVINREVSGYSSSISSPISKYASSEKI